MEKQKLPEEIQAPKSWTDSEIWDKLDWLMRRASDIFEAIGILILIFVVSGMFIGLATLFVMAILRGFR